MKLTKPSKLQPGDKVATVSLSWGAVHYGLNQKFGKGAFYFSKHLKKSQNKDM
ncbi:MAG: hypothetical protein K0Q49_1359 [Haloplasmataceae bacterium]|nr:hypothetical protein [Haloplasmataceae bacterium]